MKKAIKEIKEMRLDFGTSALYERVENCEHFTDLIFIIKKN